MPATTYQRLLTFFLSAILTLAFWFGCTPNVPDVEPAPQDTTARMDSLAEAHQDSLEQARADSLEEARQDSIELARQREQERLREQQRQREKELLEAKQALAIIYFAFDQSSLTAEARSKLQANAEILLQWPALEVVVEGHADERGTTEYNLALAERRAATVKQYYVDYGIAPDRIRTISYGEERPAVQGSTEQAWSKNRRAVTLLKE